MTLRVITAADPAFTDAKWAFSTRRVEQSEADRLDPDVRAAVSGDLILGRVASVGQHRRIQLTTGRPSALYEGDLVVLACGARYAPDQFEGVAEVDPDGADMLAGGGCLGRMTAKNERVKAPTRIAPLGRILRADGAVMNLADYALPAATRAPTIPAIAVFGASMNSGKTTAAGALVHGLRRAGRKVAALKGTGTGAFGDFNTYVDAGAHFVADFTDAGMVSTYLQPLERVTAGIRDLLSAAEAAGAEIAVLEVADGVFQKETAALMRDGGFRERLSGVIFACGDPLAAAGGVGALTAAGLAPMALTGIVSCSPMSTAEAEAATGVEVLRKSDLEDPAEANRLAARVIADASTAPYDASVGVEAA
ncbi:MAG: DUF1611 domain-containing protein [Pseudomonadota bacterium]